MMHLALSPEQLEVAAVAEKFLANELPLARITAQFLEFLDVLKFLDVDVAGEFVVTASALLEIKSRDILPTDEPEDDHREHERAEPRIPPRRLAKPLE